MKRLNRDTADISEWVDLNFFDFSLLLGEPKWLKWNQDWSLASCLTQGGDGPTVLETYQQSKNNLTDYRSAFDRKLNIEIIYSNLNQTISHINGKAHT